jgi:hypothetical protein
MTVSYWRGIVALCCLGLLVMPAASWSQGNPDPKISKGPEGSATDLIYDGRASAIGLLQPDSGLTVERIFQQDSLFPARSDGNQNDFGIQKLLDTLNVFLRGCRQLGKLPHCG